MRSIQQLNIPAKSKLFSITFTTPKDFPKDTPIYFHLHNHGANSYHLIELSLLQ